MAFPAGVITRPVTFGPAFELEDGDVAGMTVAFKATRPGVLWMETGSPAVSVAITRNASDGVEQTVYLPVTDQEGWGDGDGNAIIPGEDGHVFLYSVSIVFTQDGRTIPGAQPRSKTIAIPQGDGSPLDLDKIIPLTSPGGTVVSVPDIWSGQIAAAEAAAEAAAASVLDSAEFMGSELADPSSPAAVAVSAKIATEVAGELTDPTGPLVRGGRCHVLLAEGQSNATPADVGYPTAVIDPRIARYTAASGITTLSPSEVTLTGQLARELIRYIPPTDWILVVQAAVGSTCFTETTQTVDGATVTCSWDRANTTAQVNLSQRAITWALDAKVAALAAGATSVIFEAIVFSGFEGDTPTLTEAQFTTKAVSLFNDTRTALGDGTIPVVMGSLVPEYADLRGQTNTAGVAAALAKLPVANFISLVGFFYGPRGVAKPGEVIHYSSAGQIARGKLALDALLRARTNRAATLPALPPTLRAVRSAGRLTVSWEPLWGRPRTIEVEVTKDNGKTYSAMTIDNDSRLFATAPLWPWENGRARMRVTNDGAPVTTTDWLYSDQFVATEPAPAGVKIVTMESASSLAISPTHTGAASMYVAYTLPSPGTGSVVVNARNAGSTRAFFLNALQPSTDYGEARVGATTLSATFPAPKVPAGPHVNALTLDAAGTALKGYRGNDAVVTASGAGGDIEMSTFLATVGNGAVFKGAVLFLGAEHTPEQVARFQAILSDRYGINVTP